MKTYKLAVIPGDGTGPEVVNEALKVLDAAGEKFGFELDKTSFCWGADHYLATGEILPVKGTPMDFTKEKKIGKDIREAWEKAYEADKVSIFGGIVAINRELTKEVAELMKPIFLEIIMAPSFTDEALEILTTKKNLRLLQVDMSAANIEQTQYVTVNGGLLVQKLDTETKEIVADMCVTERKPTAKEL